MTSKPKFAVGIVINLMLISCSPPPLCNDESTLDALRNGLLRKFDIPTNIYDYHKRGLIFFEHPNQLPESKSQSNNMCQALVVVNQSYEFRISYSSNYDNNGRYAVVFKAISNKDVLNAKAVLKESFEELSRTYPEALFIPSK